MNILFHPDLTFEKWCSKSLNEQLSEVGYDVFQIMKARDTGNLQLREELFFKAHELLSLTILDPKHKGCEYFRSMVRMREFMADYFMYDNDYKSDDVFFENYFMNFNYMYAIEKGK